MKLDTKYFGRIDYAPGDLLTFLNGLFGFEEEKQFLLLPFHGSLGSLVCFQSARTPALAFVAMNPFSLDPGYHPQLSEEELYLMGAKDYSELSCYVLCAVREPVSESTVNLKCPVMVNDPLRRAAQIILETGEYHMRHRLAEFRAKGAGTPC